MHQDGHGQQGQAQRTRARCARRVAVEKNWRGIEGEDQEGERAGERTGGRGPEGRRTRKRTGGRGATVLN